MAKFLAYKRSTRNVVTVDTVNPAVTVLGNQIVGADTTNAFPNRCENLVAVFLGEAYLLYRTATNEIHLSKYDRGAGTWTDVPGFTAITTVGGALTPTCLQVEKNRLVAIAERSNSGVNDGVIARRCAAGDPTTWDPIVELSSPSQPLDSRGGPSIVWHNAVWFTTSDGICYYDPTTNTLGAFDTGDDSLISGQKVNFGCFAVWDRDLYFLLPTTTSGAAPMLYKLDRTWTTSTPTPRFTNQLVAFPTAGAVLVNNDTGNYALFVNKVGVLTALYSGDIGSKLVRIQRVGTALSATDVSDPLLPADLRAEPHLGFSFYADDRRRLNEQHTILVRYRPSIPVAVLVGSWDGVSAITINGTLDDGGVGLDLILPEDERGDFRTWTNNQPVCAITATSQPFPGRVRLDYIVRDEHSRPVDVFGEYSIDGQTWLPMTQGDGDSGSESLGTVPTGSAYFFYWDAFNDLQGDSDHIDVRLIARISGV